MLFVVNSKPFLNLHMKETQENSAPHSVLTQPTSSQKTSCFEPSHTPVVRIHRPAYAPEKEVKILSFFLLLQRLLYYFLTIKNILWPYYKAPEN